MPRPSGGEFAEMDQAFDAVCHADEDTEGHHFGDRAVQDLPDMSAARERHRR